MKLKIKYLSDKIGREISPPRYATDGAAGMDLCAATEEPIILKKGALALVPTGIAIAVCEGCAAFIYARSGLGVKHGICLSNGVGVVDSDYRGEIKVSAVNLSEQDYTIKNGDKIAQMVFSPVIKAELEEADGLDDTVRADGGFGSTGR